MIRCDGAKPSRGQSTCLFNQSFFKETRPRSSVFIEWTDLLLTPAARHPFRRARGNSPPSQRRDLETNPKDHPRLMAFEIDEIEGLGRLVGVPPSLRTPCYGQTRALR